MTPSTDSAPTDSTEPKSGPKLRARHLVLGAVLSALAVSMAAMARYDYQWTLWLNDHRISWIENFLGRTIFEGEGYGGSDSAIIYMAIFVILYFIAWLKPGHRRLLPWRPQLGFVVVSGLVCGIYMVHSLKWVVGRARPRMVFKKGMAYTEWYEIGPHYITEGIYRGSFPSGHTASVLLFLTLAYILYADRHGSVRQRSIGFIWGVLSILYCFFMAIGRSMSFGHWLGDCLFTLFFGWALMHALYFWVLHIPEQIDYFQKHGVHAETPRLWEIQFGWLLFLIVLGFVAFGFGIRAFWEQPLPWLALLILPGAFMMVCFGRKLLRFRKRVITAFD